VKDHLAHLAMWHEIRASEIERISAGLQSAWPHLTDEQTEGFNALIADLRVDLPLAQVLAELDRARARVLDAIDRASERGLDAANYGEAALRSDHELAHAGWIKRWRQERGI
jgi:hypothetical protein